MFLFCPQLEMYRDFQTGKFAYFKKFKTDSNFGDFGQLKTDPSGSLLLSLGRSQLFY